MPSGANQADWKVVIRVEAAGPIRPRTKHKKHKLLRAEGTIALPFVPYPGLYLTFSKARPRGELLKLYLRVRCVEWDVTGQQFECVADEAMGSSVSDETVEVRGPAKIEQHFVELQRALETFGFSVDIEADSIMIALHKRADGSVIEVSRPN